MDKVPDETIRSLQKRIREQYELLAIMFPHWLAKGAPIDREHIDVLRLVTGKLDDLVDTAHYELTSRKSE